MNLKKFISFALSAILIFPLSACGDDESDGMNYAFNYALDGNPQNLDPQIATDSVSLTVIENMFEGLVSVNESGNLDYGIAKSCSISDDCLTYTFKLRDDRYWYDGNDDEFPVTADDFVFAFQRIFNPVTQSPYKETFSFLKNGEKIINNQLEYTEIGVYAPDESTVVFELDYAEPCFMELLASSPAMPCNQEFFESTEARYGLDDESVISDGAFYMKQWFYDEYGKENFITMKANNFNSQGNEICPSGINFIIERTDTDKEEKFHNGEYDCIYSDTQSDYKNILSRPFDIYEYSDTTVGIIINSEQIADENLRKALAFSVDRNLYSDKLAGDYQTAYGIIPPYISVGNSKYRDYANEKQLYDYDNSEFQNFFSQCENIPDTLTILTTSDYAETVYINEIAKQWQDKLGIEVKVQETDINEYKRAIAERDYQLAVYSISAGCSNPYDVLEIFKSGNNSFGYSNENTDNLLKQSETVNGTEKKCGIYFETEKNIIDNCGFLPIYYKKAYFICTNGSENILFNPFSHTVNFRYGKNYS